MHLFSADQIRPRKGFVLISVGIAIILAATFAFCATAVVRAISAPRDNAKLAEMYNQDQDDRASGPNQIAWKIVSKHDADRLSETEFALLHNQIRTAKDYFYAAMIFQHSNSAHDAMEAHILAYQASKIDPSLANTKWLSAAAWDRYLMWLGKPQWYGTQYVKNPQGDWILYKVNTSAVTDAERAELGVPSLSDAEKFVGTLNKKP